MIYYLNSRFRSELIKCNAPFNNLKYIYNIKYNDFVLYKHMECFLFLKYSYTAN